MFCVNSFLLFDPFELVAQRKRISEKFVIALSGKKSDRSWLAHFRYLYCKLTNVFSFYFTPINIVFYQKLPNFPKIRPEQVGNLLIIFWRSKKWRGPKFSNLNKMFKNNQIDQFS